MGKKNTNVSDAADNVPEPPNSAPNVAEKVPVATGATEKKTGLSRQMKIAIVVGLVVVALAVVGIVLAASGFSVTGACDGLAPGVHEIADGTTVSCY